MVARVRIEFVRLRPPGDEGAIDPTVLAAGMAVAETLEIGAVQTETTPIATLTAPGGYDSGWYARVTCVEGAGLVLAGADPVINDGNGFYIALGGQPLHLPVKVGDSVATIALGAVAAPSPGGGADGSLDFSNPDNSALFTLL